MKTIKIQSILMILILIFSGFAIGTNALTDNSNTLTGEYKISHRIHNASAQDFDPLSDIEVIFKLRTIRSLERTDHHINVEKKIDPIGQPDFYVIVTINDVEFTSPIWENTVYLYDINWTATLNVPDDNELVRIKIQLLDSDLGRDKPCDISSYYDKNLFLNYDAEIIYSIATGQWTGDDLVNAGFWFYDPSGYGRLNGCDDRSYYNKERDCELWFDVYQTDPDGDGIPYWTEVNVFGTDPMLDNTGEDYDNDLCPIEWEHKWGHQMWIDDENNETEHYWIFDPTKFEAHNTFDPDRDGLDNVEEHLTSQWGSDPFRKDLFIEFDEMEPGPDELMVLFPLDSKELLTTAYNSRNIVYHLDDGCLGGGESIPFTERTLNRNDLKGYYYQYFLHGDLNNWRIGVFHYALHLYDAGWAGYAFDNGYTGHLDSCQISSKYHEEYVFGNPIYNLMRRQKLNMQKQRERVYAAVLMHETGHTLGIFHGNTPGCDNSNTLTPLQFDFWKYGKYLSVMNYRYVYSGLMDYSDGSRGKYDFNDWDTLDLTFFQS